MTTTSTHPGGRRPGTNGQRRSGRARALVAIVIIGLVAIIGVVLLALEPESSAQGHYLVGAWTYGDRASLDRALETGAIDEVSCDWLQSCADGSLKAPREDADFADDLRKDGVRTFITLTDYDQERQRFEPSIAAAILATPEARRSHAAAVAAWTADHGYDGIDLDWEALTKTQRDTFSAFVEELALAAHDRGLLLAVDVHPKESEPGGWDGAQAQDWHRLGEAVDQFRIMTYNYSGSWSGPGALSPPDWMDRVLDFAEEEVEPSKIVMGVGFYGRSWTGDTTTDLVWSDVEHIAGAHGMRRSRDSSRELRLQYSNDEQQKSIAYFPDAKALRAKLRMMLRDHPDIGGVCCWCMGQEDPDVWPVLAAQLRE